MSSVESVESIKNNINYYLNLYNQKYSSLNDLVDAGNGITDADREAITLANTDLATVQLACRNNPDHCDANALSAAQTNATITAPSFVLDKVRDFNNKIDTLKSQLNTIYNNIHDEAAKLVTLAPTMNSTNLATRQIVDSGASNLSSKIDALDDSYRKLMDKLQEPIKLDGNYEISKIKTSANFINYMLSLLFAIFVLICLCLLHFYPTLVYLDMFIMALAAIIIAYYGYDYFENRPQAK